MRLQRVGCSDPALGRTAVSAAAFRGGLPCYGHVRYYRVVAIGAG